MLEPFLCIVLDGEFDDLELDARWRVIFTLGAFVQTFFAFRFAG
jgi:hypothetical protein